MRRGILICTVWALAAACAAHAAEEAAEPDEYVVWVDETELRAEPSVEAGVVTTFVRGVRLSNLSEKVTRAEGEWWRRVRGGDFEGWVVDQKVIPDFYYAPFSKADELGKAGDAEGMVAAIAEGVETLASSSTSEGPYYSVSPDGRKVFVDVSPVSRFDWWDDYPIEAYTEFPTPVLYFVNGSGLRDYFLFDYFSLGKWSSDSRYYLYLAWFWLETIDTELWSEEGLAGIYWFVDFSDFEFIGDYFVCMTWEFTGDTASPGYEDPDWPVVMAFNPATGEQLRLLEADRATLESEAIPGWGFDYYEVKMVPAENCPDVFKEAKLYKKFNGKYARARSSNA